MERKSFSLPEMSQVDFSISYMDIDATSPLNQNDAHFHRECEIYLNLSGDVSFEVENTIYPISRGSVIITRPFEYHHCIYHSNEQHKHYWITFLAEERESYLEMFFCREKGKDNLIHLNESQLEVCCGVLNSLLQSRNDPLSRRIDFLRLLRILSSGKGEDIPEQLQKMPQDVLRALRFMDAHLLEDFDIKTLSAACSVSVNTLERHFKKTLGLVPFAMLRKKRLIFSMEHLRNGDSVTEAALKSGFADYSNYIQHFRKQFGLTPLQYKKQFETQ